MPWVAAVLVSIAIGGFVALHTGPRADAACEQATTFVPSDGISVWPPGARCTYGEPSRTVVVRNVWFLVLIGLLILAGIVAHAIVVIGPRTT